MPSRKEAMDKIKKMIEQGCTCDHSDTAEKQACPFNIEMYGNYDKVCTCCNYCAWKCKQDV